MPGSLKSVNRRDFIAKTTLGSLFVGLPRGCVGSAYADNSPESPKMRFGIIALTDCSPIVIAHEKGFFKKHGIDSSISKEASWAVIRDKLITGENQGTHMLIGMPVASTLGIMGSAKKPMICPWNLNRNGQAITLKRDWIGKVKDDPKAIKPFAEKAKSLGEPLTFAMTFPPGTHAMWLRYYLAAGGMNPDKDVQLIVIPPPQMVANMKVGKMDGFCVGEPWNTRAISDKVGFTSITTQEIWKDHPEKVCAFMTDFAEKNPKTVKATLKALHEASIWLDDFKNRPEQCEIVSKASYVNCPKETILPRLLGDLDYGDGRVRKDEMPMHFSMRNCNYPQTKYIKWWLTQLRRWGMINSAPDYGATAAKIARPDLYEDAMKELGYSHGGSNAASETLFDGAVFDPSKPEEYARSFAINSLKG